MENKLRTEISYFTRLIEHHKQTTSNKNLFGKPDDPKLLDITTSLPSYTQPNKTIRTSYQAHVLPRQDRSKYSYVKPQLPQSNKVHVNPNFKPKTSVIHINPKISVKPSVHINPKMMKDFDARITNSEPETLRQSQSDTVRKKIESLVHVNPKLIKEFKTTVHNPVHSTINVQEQPHPSNSNIRVEPSQLESHANHPSVTKRTNPNVPVLLVQRKSLNSSFISLSRRKLVRVRRNSKSGSAISPMNSGRTRKLSITTPQKSTVATKYKLVVTRGNNISNATTTIKSLQNRSVGSNKYKIDRTHVQKVKKRLSGGKNSLNTAGNKTSNCTTGLVRIGGILYKSSRNQLVRSNNDSSPPKRKRSIINVKGDRFVMASNGKKLRRISTIGVKAGNISQKKPVSRVDIGRMTFVEKTPNVLVRSYVKTNISAKAKQRSIQILRNKMRKNNQPCLIFQRFGYCAGQVKGTCPKLHDKKQVALCRNFLQGKCLLDNCPLSHAVCPEKMPTCKYFLEGCCIRDECPYLHVKVSSKTPICVQFLRGYCAEANKCKQRHVYACPEFDRSRKCSKGKYCPYPHKSPNSAAKKSIKPQKKLPVKIKAVESETTVPICSHVGDRKRYYDESDTSKDNLEKKRQRILKTVEIMKFTKLAERNASEGHSPEMNANCERTTSVNSAEPGVSDSEDACPKRTPLGILPAYIPID